MNRQEIFETVLEGIASQGFVKSVDCYGRCAYRGHDGLKCAIGHLIKDEDYTRGIEGIGVFDIVLPEYLVNDNDTKFIELLSELQDAHDNYLEISVKSYLEHMYYISEKFDLIFPDKYRKMIRA